MAPRGKTATLSIVIAGDAKGAQKAMSQTEAGAKGLTRTVGGLAGSVGALLAGGAIIRWGRDFVDTARSVGGELVKLQRLTGGSDEFIPGLYVAAQQSGVAVDKLTTSIGILSSKIQRGTLEKFGIETKTATGAARSFEDILGDIQDRYAELSGAERVDFAKQLFGKGGVDIMPLLAKTREEMQGFIDDAKRLGIELNSHDIKAATKNQRDFQLALTAAKVTLGNELLPLVTSFTSVAAKNLPAVANAVGTVAEVFNSLPAPMKTAVGLAIAFGPAIRVIGLALTPLKLGAQYLASTKVGLVGFRAGLLGAQTASGGAANSFGLFLSKAAASPALMAGAAVGIGVLLASFLAVQQQSAAAKADIDQLVASAESGGKTIEESFRERLAKSLAGDAGGFSGSQGKTLSAYLDRLGIDAEEFFRIIRAGGDELANLRAQLGRVGLLFGDEEAPYNAAQRGVDRLRSAWTGAADQQRELTRRNEELGVSTDDATEATDRNTRSVDSNREAIARGLEVVQRRRDKLDAIASADRAYADAQEAVKDTAERLTDAQEDLSEAQREAQGDSEAMRDAREAEADANEAVADAVDEVAAKHRDLADAIAEATERYEDNQLAAREAADSQKQAALDVEKARQARDDALRNSKLSDVERQQAQLDYEQALTDQAKAQEAAQDAANEAAKGVEQDQAVIDARQALADAEDGVTEARERAADAAENTAKVQQDALARVEEAQGRVEEATKANQEASIAWAEAWGDLVEKQTDAKTGAIAYRDALLSIRDTLAPGSDLRNYVDMLITKLTTLASLGGGLLGEGGRYGSVDAAERGEAARQPDPPPDLLGPGPRGRPNREGYRGPTVNLTVNGSDVQTRRAAQRMLRDELDRAARDMGGG